nr:MAG TPA: hypothetical protein [Caudoviricetes sp.]
MYVQCTILFIENQQFFIFANKNVDIESTW